MISVVMASYLGEYQGAAANREDKLHRAIDSFIAQGVGELIVVSDGCEKTNAIVTTYSNHSNIRLIRMPKMPLFSGEIRNAGIAAAKHNWICYLDSDDEFKHGHLKAIVDNIDNTHDWMFYDDYVGDTRRDCCVAPCRIGTSCIVHRKDTPVKWPSGYNHDWYFIAQFSQNYKKIDGTGYTVHHIPGKVDT